MYSYLIPNFIQRICLGILLINIFYVCNGYSKEQARLTKTEISIPKQQSQIALYHAVEALPNPIGKITEGYLLDSKVDTLFLPLSHIKYSFLSGGMWLRLPLEGKSISGQYLFLNLGSFVSLPISIYRSVTLDSKVSFEKLGTYETTRINLQTADLKPEGQYTYYISVPTIPSPFFAPILENGNSKIANTVSILQILCFGILIIAILFSFLRAILQKKPLFLLLPFFSICILISLLFGVPNTSPGFIQLDSLPTMLSAIFAVVLFPLFSLFAIAKNGDFIPKMQKNIAVGITILVFCIIIIPLIPTMAFLSRYFPFWPLLLLFSFPISLYALQKGYTNALLYFIACIAPTVFIGITTISVFLYVDAFLYVETLPIIGVTISVVCITLFRIPFTFLQERKDVFPRDLGDEEEPTPYWMQNLETTEEDESTEYSEEDNTEVSDEEYDIPTTVKERVVQAMNREPNIIPYSPRELFVYLYRALKKYSENYNVELSWFVDPDLDENQEHDSDVIYNTLYSIGESLIINNPNSSVHISAKKITDTSLPSHIRFSITITPEDMLHTFNSNSIANIAELIALAGGTLFMGNAQGKKMEMIITLPAVAKLISLATTPKEVDEEYKPIDKQAEAIEQVIDSELEAYDTKHRENPLLEDLEQAVESVLPSEPEVPTTSQSEEITTVVEQEPVEETLDIEEEQDTSYIEHELTPIEEDTEESFLVSVEEEQQALAELRSELERLTEQQEEEYSQLSPISPSPETITLVGESNILEDIEEDTSSHRIPTAPLIPPITKMPLPKTDKYGNEIIHDTPFNKEEPSNVAVTIHDIVNEYLDTLDAEVEETDSIEEPSTTDIIVSEDIYDEIPETIEPFTGDIKPEYPQIEEYYSEDQIQDTVPGLYSITSSEERTITPIEEHDIIFLEKSEQEQINSDEQKEELSSSLSPIETIEYRDME
ncbi:MAG: hypothetical protein K2M30_02195 [Desulfovibrionaceae bacterium]|nr:hypothetical protein [Desulfovibrionaceae bacterium]